jgi:Spy/CpxP family protein refolding chaperone
MKSIHLRLLIATLAVLLGTTIGKSQTATNTPPPTRVHTHQYGMHRHGMGFFPRSLNLTDAQHAQIKAILEKERPVMKPLFQQSRQIDQQLRQFAEGTFDEGKVRTLATQKAQVEVELAVQKTRIHNELFQLLTTDQQAKMKEIEANRQTRMQNRMQQPAPAAPEQ